MKQEEFQLMKKMMEKKITMRMIKYWNKLLIESE